MKRRGPLAAFLAFGMLWGGWAALAPAVQAAVGASKGQLGLALLFVALGSLPAMLLTGRALDRRGTRILPWLIVGLALSALLPAFAGSVPVLAASLLVFGVFAGATDVAMNGAVSELEARREVRLMQIAHALFSAGFLVAAVAVGLARGAGVGPLPILAGIAALALVAAALNRGYPDVPRVVSPRRFTFSRRLIVLGLLCALAFVIEGGIEGWSALFLETELQASPAVGGLGPGCFAAAMVAGRLAGQWLELRLGDRVLLACGAATAAVGLCLAAVAPAVPFALLGFALGGAGVSVAAPVLFGAAGRGAPDSERGSAVASVTTISYLGFLAGPPLIGAVSGALSLRAGIGLLAVIALLLAVSAAGAREALGRHP